MYSPTDKSHWQGRTDKEDGALGMRWHQRMKFIDLAEEPLPKLDDNQVGTVLLGFACDEGVRRNKGRTGAIEGPFALRKACENLADHLPQDMPLFDGGDVVCQNNDLKETQEELTHYIQTIVSAGYFPLVFGGGHEVAFPHFSGLFNSLPSDRTIGIINIDAHFDLRSPANGSSSGTPFSEIASLCQEHGYPFHYLCIGIQAPYNTAALFQQARDLGVHFLMNNELQLSLTEHQKTTMSSFMVKCNLIYLTICLDVFDIAFAPGVSAPSVSGIFPALAIDVIRYIKASGKLCTANIAELNPSLDQDSKTARLAARLAYEIISDPPS